MEVFEKLLVLNVLVFLLVCQNVVIGAPQLYPDLRKNSGSKSLGSLYPSSHIQQFVDKGEELEAQPSYYKRRTVHYYYAPRRSSKAIPYFLVGLAAGSAAVLGGALAGATAGK